MGDLARFCLPASLIGDGGACGGGWSLTAEAQLTCDESEDPKVDRVLSRSEDSDALELVDGACGWEQDGQLHGASL